MFYALQILPRIKLIKNKKHILQIWNMEFFKGSIIKQVFLFRECKLYMSYKSLY